MRLPATSDWDALQTAAHAWQVDPDDIDARTLELRCTAWLSPEERTRLDRLPNDRLKHVYLTSRALCRGTLSRYTDVDPAAWTFVANAHGKPAIAAPVEFETLRFNLTHSEGLLACLVTRAGQVGVDVEETSRGVDADRIAHHFFSAAEQACLTALGPEQRRGRFFEYWVVKEAYLKGCATGLSRSPEQFTVQFDEDGQPSAIDRWQLTLHRPTPRHVAATAVWRQPDIVAVPVTWRVYEGLL